MKGRLEWISRKKDLCFIGCQGNHYLVEVPDIDQKSQIQPYDTVIFEKDAISGAYKLLCEER